MRVTKLALRPVRIDRRNYWQVTVPLPGGGRKQKAFADKAEAAIFLENCRQELEKRGRADLLVNASIREDAATALSILNGTGATLTQAARAYVRSRRKPKR